MSKRQRSPSPINTRTLANVVRRDKTPPKDADYIDLALCLIRLFEGFGPCLLRYLVTHIVKAELRDHVHLHTVENPRARPRAYQFTQGKVDTYFDNEFLVKRVKWWSRLFANILTLRSTFIRLEELEREFWVGFNLCVGTLKPKVPFFIARDPPGPHFLGDWIMFRAPMVPAMLFHLDGTLNSHQYYPLSMPGFNFYARFPASPLSIEAAVDLWGQEIDVANIPAGISGGPGIPFTSITTRSRDQGSDEYKLNKRMVIWKEKASILPGVGVVKFEWVVDREIGKGLVDDFNSSEQND